MFIWKDQFETLVAERDRFFNSLTIELSINAGLRSTNNSLAESNRKLVLENRALTDQLKIQTAGTSANVPAKITTTVPLVGKIKSKRKKK